MKNLLVIALLIGCVESMAFVNIGSVGSIQINQVHSKKIATKNTKKRTVASKKKLSYLENLRAKFNKK